MTATLMPAKTNGAESRIIEYVPFGDTNEPIKLSMSIVRDFVANKTKSGKLPSDTQLMKFMMLCKSRRLNPFEGDAFLVGYDTKDGPNFSLITAHQAFLKRAELSKEFDGMESGVMVIDADGNLRDREGDFYLESDTLVGAWAVVHFKSRKYPMRDRVALKTFRKQFGRWNEDAGGMIVKCAESSVLRKAFPTMLGGLYTEDETPTPRADPEPPKAALVERIKMNGKPKPAEQPPAEVEGEIVEEPHHCEPETHPGPVMVDVATVKQIQQEIIDLALDDRQMRTKYGVKEWKELTLDLACDILATLRGAAGEE